MSLKIEHAGLTDKGRVRDHNEDNWATDPAHGLYIVSDGLGGQLAGEVASKIVVETLPAMLRQRLTDVADLAEPFAYQQLLEAIAELSHQVYEQTKGQLGLEGMGATVVLALIRDSKALIAHMGDSRAYLLRDGKLKRLTRDHSIVQLLIDNGEIKPEQAVTHPARGRVTRSIGMEGEPLPEARVLQIKSGDRLLLCSDGLVGMLTDKKIQSILKNGTDPAATSRRLIDAANEAGGKDNVTAVIITVSEETASQKAGARVETDGRHDQIPKPEIRLESE